jgi:rubrerythrin
MKTVAHLYAHAIAIEREAAARYSEFAERMADLGNEAAAEVFATLARLEAEHLDELVKRTAGMALPELAAHEYAWLDAGGPETAARELVFRLLTPRQARELVFRLLTPRQALEIALQGEKRAAAFFESVVLSAGDPMLCALAIEMAADEADHIVMIEKLLERTPSAIVDWASAYARETP